MIQDMSLHWEGKAFLVKRKDSYVIVNRHPLLYNKFITRVLPCDARGVVLTWEPLEEIEGNHLDKLCKKYEHKQRKTKPFKNLIKDMPEERKDRIKVQTTEILKAVKQSYQTQSNIPVSQSNKK